MGSILIYADLDHTTKTFVAELAGPWLTYLRSKGF
jgi:predicted mannosyl-3-phosphoglycerate phosphatase (HAD superfamily)